MRRFVTPLTPVTLLWPIPVAPSDAQTAYSEMHRLEDGAVGEGQVRCEMDRGEAMETHPPPPTTPAFATHQAKGH
jgi:hypothetical protein